MRTFLNPRRSAKAYPKRRFAESGSSLTEFAFVFIPLSIILFGTLAFGHMLYTYHFVNHAAKEAARWAIVNGYLCTNDSSCTAPPTCSNGGCTLCTTSCTYAATSDIQNYAIGLTPPGIDYTTVNATASFQAPTNSPNICTAAVGGVGPHNNYPGCTVKVTVYTPFTFIFPLVPATNTITAPCTTAGWCLSSTAEMVIVH